MEILPKFQIVVKDCATVDAHGYVIILHSAVIFREWVTWARKMLGCLDSLEDGLREAYSFLLSYRGLIEELYVCVKAITYLESLCTRA